MVKMHPTRKMILEALEVQANAGATREDLIALCGWDEDTTSRKAVGTTVGHLLSEELVIERRGKFYLKEFAPKPALIVQSHQNGAGAGVAPLPPIAQKRQGKTLSVYRSAITLVDVIGLYLLIENHWYEIPFFDSLRICIGMERPNWGPEARGYTDCTKVRIMFKNGKTEEENIAPKEYITIAPEE